MAKGKFMKIVGLVAAFILLTPSALAQIAPVDLPLLAAQNFIPNPGFENGAQSWTASGGATKTANTTAKANGTNGYEWNSNGSSQTLRSKAIAIPDSLKGRNAVVSCLIKAASGSPTTTITVDDETTPFFTAQTIRTSTSAFTRNTFNFIAATSGNMRLSFASVASDEPSIYIDDCGIWEADKFNLAQVSQAQIIGSAYFATTGSCTFTRTNTALGALSDSDCPGPTVEYNPGPGTIQTTDANAPVVTVNNLAPGDYEVGFIGASAIGTGAQLASLAINDGTSTRGQVSANNSTTSAPFHVKGQFSYTSVGNKSFELYASSAANAFNIDLTASNQRLYFYIVKIPGSGEQALRPDLMNWRVDANISGANPSLGTTDISSYTGIEHASLTLTNNTGRGTIAAQIPCSSTNAPSGTTCSAGNESVGVSFNLPIAGDVLACASATWHVSASGSVSGALQVVETPSNAQTISQEGKSRVAAFVSGGIMGQPMRVCGTFTFSTAGQKTLRLFYEQDATATVTSSLILADAGAAEGQRDIHWEVYPINQAMPVPILVGSVSSGTTGTERVERVRVDGGTGTIITQSGAWITNLNKTGTGSYTLTIASGYFTATPACVCTIFGNDRRNCTINGTPSATSLEISTHVDDGSTSIVDSDFSAICMGPK